MSTARCATLLPPPRRSTRRDRTLLLSRPVWVRSGTTVVSLERISRSAQALQWTPPHTQTALVMISEGNHVPSTATLTATPAVTSAPSSGRWASSKGAVPAPPRPRTTPTDDEVGASARGGPARRGPAPSYGRG